MRQALAPLRFDYDDKAMAEAGVSFAGLDAVAVTQAPGLVCSLLVGLQAANPNLEGTGH